MQGTLGAGDRRQQEASGAASLMRVSMLRILSGAFALACGAVQAMAGSLSPGPEDGGSGPMRFEWRSEGPAEVCGESCRVWISAAGYITSDTPRQFETFAKDPKTRGAVLVVDSEGGSVLGTLALGRSLRGLDMIPTTGKTAPLRPVGSMSRLRMVRPSASVPSTEPPS